MGTTVVMMMGRILLLVLSTAMAAPQGNFSHDSLEETILDRSAVANPLLEERAINTCGCAPVSSADRIVGGKEVNPKGKLPYQVLFRPCTPNGLCSLCGGTIVNEGDKRVKVKKITSHPDYDKGSKNNDIAVLELVEDLTFTDKVKPACLPSSADKDYSGSASTISGWGGTIGYEGLDQPVQPKQCAMKESIVKLLASSEDKCRDELESDGSILEEQAKMKLCAWAKGTDTCQGDSGGPLAVPENGKYTLVGVVSYGMGCASSSPGIYARVQNYRPWSKNLVASGECSGSSGGATTSRPTTAGPTTTASSNGNGDYGNGDYGNGDYGNGDYGNYGNY